MKISMTQEMRSYLQHVRTLETPAHIDDAADFLDEVLDHDLHKICDCREPDLRNKLQLELIDIDLELPSDNCGWVVEILGEGKAENEV